MFFIVSDALLLLFIVLAFTVVIAIVDEVFILYKEYLLNPKEFSKNSFILISVYYLMTTFIINWNLFW